MPRSINPRWGDDGYGDVEPFSLTADQANGLAHLLGLADDPGVASHIHAAVRNIGDTYRRWRGRGAAAFTRSQARKALELLLAADRVDYAAITILNERAFQCVYDSLVMMKPAPVSNGDTVYAALIGDRFGEEILRDAIRDAIKELKATKGPDREGEIGWAVEQLCRLYEDLTGRTATHSNKGKLLAYQSGPRSHVGRFVQACMKLVDPEVRETQVSGSLRFYIKGRKQRREQDQVHTIRNIDRA